METLSVYLTDEHRNCDELFMQAEDAVTAADWPRSHALFEAFSASMERHMGREETILFPALEERSGGEAGPTTVMRAEHVQIRDLLQQMDTALSARNSDRYLGLSETLMIMMQQHNVKEEHILYPMCDQVLRGMRHGLLTRLREAESPGCA